MKKQLLALSALLLVASSLTSCRQETSDSDNSQEVADALNAAKVSVNFNGDITSIYVDDAEAAKEGNVDITIGNGFMEFNKTYDDFNGNAIKYDYAFEKDENGKIAYKRLNLQNKIEMTTFKATYKEKELDFDSYCLNPFANLEVSDFTLREGRYYLNKEKVNAFKGLVSLCSTEMYHFYDVEVASVSFSLSNSKFKDVMVYTVPQTDGLLSPADFFYKDTFALIFPGEISIRTISTKTHRPEHDILKKALESLQTIIDGKNYTINVNDVESTETYSADYDVLYTEDNMLSYFRPAISSTIDGYKKGEDNKFYKYKYFLYDESSSGHKKGDAIYDTESSKYVMDRSSLECNFLAFAPEFFIRSGNSFVTTNSDVVGLLRNYLCSFDLILDEYYVPTKIFFNLSEDNQNPTILSWGFVAMDYVGGFEDTFTFTLKDVDSTVIPTFSIGA